LKRLRKLSQSPAQQFRKASMSVGGKVAGAVFSGAPVEVTLASVKAAVLAWQTPIVSVAGLG
jgi:hypothetical protein